MKIMSVEAAAKKFSAAKPGDAITYFSGGHKSGVRETLYQVCSRKNASKACAIRQFAWGLYESRAAHLVCKHTNDGLDYQMVKR